MSDRIPEPTGVGPSVGGGLRASDADRELVSAVLTTAYAEGRITREEHDERQSQALAARTFDDLVPITHDLVPLATAAGQEPSVVIDTRTSSDEPEKLVAVFGGVTRKGRWRVRRRIQALAVFGGMDLDLREAVFESPEVEISGFWCFGGLDMKVPAGVEIRDQTAGIFGGTDVRDVGEPTPGAPVLVIKGVTLFGGVSVKGPRVKGGQRKVSTKS